METTEILDSTELVTHIVGDIARAVSERNGETTEQWLCRFQAAVDMIMGFQPHGVVETMLAGHSVMLHELVVHGVGEFLRADMVGVRRARCGDIVALEKCFGDNLNRLEHHQQRPAQHRDDAPKAVETRSGDAAAAEPAVGIRALESHEDYVGAFPQ